MRTIELIKSKITFYAKKIQCNEFYPICKFSWDEQKEKYVRYERKTKDFIKYYYITSAEYNINELIYLFENNGFILSSKEMFDDLNYNEL